MPGRLRWVAFGIVTLATGLNYLDRQVLAALAPQIRDEFALSNADYGLLLAAFSITYALSSPLAGYLIDRAGLTRGISYCRRDLVALRHGDWHGHQLRHPPMGARGSWGG